jgi:23S rRNA (guanine745-N1)-methyltransferase
MLKCTHGHTFDIAREGYVNLLRKQLPGDTREMLVARRQFLEHYRPLSDTLNTLVYTHATQWPQHTPSTLHILDAGCGEGYYLGRLQDYLQNKQLPTHISYIGVDISKDAVKMAAKRYHDAFFVVANLKERLPFPDGSLDVILNIFAPRNTDEFARVLTPGGLLLVAIPNPIHLLQLRAALHLLNIEEDKQQHVIEQFAHQFTLQTTTPVTYTLHLRGEQISQAVMMTPNYWHLSQETRQAIADLTEIQTEAGFICLAFRRN